MKLEILLAWIGIILGVPGFLLLFFTSHVTSGLLVFAFVAVLVWVRWELGRPEFTILEIEKILTFHDSQASRATLVRRHKARANHKGLTEFWCGNISTDGSLQNVQVDGQDPHAMKTEAGDLRICKRFPRPSEHGEIYEMQLSYDLLKSFEGNPEGLIHVCSYKTKRLKMVVVFHPEKPCRSARAYIRFGGQPHERLPQPKISEDATRAEIELTRIKLGGEYCLEWNW
jgi:hypothetical protein